MKVEKGGRCSEGEREKKSAISFFGRCHPIGREEGRGDDWLGGHPDRCSVINLRENTGRVRSRGADGALNSRTSHLTGCPNA